MQSAFAIYLLLSLPIFGQESANCPPRERFKSLRYDEDWSGLRDPNCRNETLDSLKFIAIGRYAYISLGGEARLRYERYDNPGFGTDPETDSGYILQRYLLHADVHFTPATRAFVQFQSGLENGRNGGPRPTDEDTAEFHQAFLDLPVAHLRGVVLIMRVGRQELEFGSGRITGAAEGLNIRRSYDGLRLHYALPRWSFNAILLRPVLPRRGAFDDVPDHRQTFWGIGGTKQMSRGGASLYYYGLDRKLLRLGQFVGRDVRHTVGGRWWGSRGRWDHNDEYFVQFGQFSDGALFAGGASFDMGWTFETPRPKPRIGFRVNVASGGIGTSANDSFHTFLPLFPNPAYASRNALIGPANLLQATPTFQATLGKLTISFDSPFSWRSSVTDGIYNFASLLIRPGNQTGARYVGSQPGGQLEVRLNAYVSGIVAYSHFFAGDFLRNTPPGKDVDYVYLSTTFRF